MHESGVYQGAGCWSIHGPMPLLKGVKRVPQIELSCQLTGLFYDAEVMGSNPVQA